MSQHMQDGQPLSRHPETLFPEPGGKFRNAAHVSPRLLQLFAITSSFLKTCLSVFLPFRLLNGGTFSSSAGPFMDGKAPLRGRSSLKYGYLPAANLPERTQKPACLALLWLRAG
jgi:hypothetical protein